MSHGTIEPPRGTALPAVWWALRFDVLGGVASFHTVLYLRGCGSRRFSHEADIRGADAVGVL